MTRINNTYDKNIEKELFRLTHYNNTVKDSQETLTSNSQRHSRLIKNVAYKIKEQHKDNSVFVNDLNNHLSNLGIKTI